MRSSQLTSWAKSRLRAAGAGIAENERVVTIGGLDALRDRLYVLDTAIEDVERDLADGDAGLNAYQEALDWCSPPLARS